MTADQGAKRSGQAWENRAAEYLKGLGVTIIARGYRCRMGELDILGSDGDGLIVFEVKARSGRSHERAVDCVGPGKRQRIINATRHFLMRNPEWFSLPIRFDVIAVENIDEDCPTLNWIRNAFDAT